MGGDFEIIKKDVMGRIGILRTRSGKIETPTILPVINPKNIVVSPREMKKIGADAVITNSYIIYSSPKLRGRARKEGLHKMLQFNGPIMTDSGSFQLSVYGDIDVESKEILRFQKDIGSDICIPIDIPTKPDERWDKAKKDVEITLERLREMKEIRREFEDLSLVAPIQGSTHKDLREMSAREAGKLDFDIYAIGAVVPLLEEYRYRDLVDVVLHSKFNLPINRPVHLFGAGHPMTFSLAVLMGCDLFDSAAYVLYAMDKRYLTVNGTHKLSELRYFPCNCPVCSEYSPREVMESGEDKRTRLLALHNLYESFSEIKRIKQAIVDGRLWELVQIRCRSHPRLLDALRNLIRYSGEMERFDPSTKSAFFYGGIESNERTEVLRYRRKLEAMEIKKTPALITTLNRELEDFEEVYYLKPPFGPFPKELEETYPFNCETPDIFDEEMVKTALGNVIILIENEKNRGKEIFFEYDERYDHPLIEEVKRCTEVKKGRCDLKC